MMRFQISGLVHCADDTVTTRAIQLKLAEMLGPNSGVEQGLKLEAVMVKPEPTPSRDAWLYLRPDGEILQVMGPHVFDGTPVDDATLTALQEQGVCVKFCVEYQTADANKQPAYVTDGIAAQMEVGKWSFAVSEAGLKPSSHPKNDKSETDDLWVCLRMPV